ncbi:hypothetical protein NliqN6_2533 [Naganishia liquefaciens]|uniref:Sister chromatid cohesion protein n=1 Tax=Naganishia liquefaciens TaxID=104408 RepID=A0A8H3TRJ6_9TREE|nr:hypothetical protein NliqN6_2533 [Naganishia liquefaciens]
MSGPPRGHGTNGRADHHGQSDTPAQPRHSGTGGMVQQQGYATPSSSAFGQSASNTASDPSVREVLGLYPFMQYTPSSRVAKHLSSLTLTHPSIPSLEAQHPEHLQDFARLSTPISEADDAFWLANMREAERLIGTYGTGIGGGAERESGLGGSVSMKAPSGRAQHRQPNLTYANHAIPSYPPFSSPSNPQPNPDHLNSYMAEALLARVVPPVSTPFGHPVANEHYYTQAEEFSGAANGTTEKITPLQYLNQYVEDITAQRLAQAREQSAREQRPVNQVNTQGFPVRDLSAAAQSATKSVDTKSVGDSASRSSAGPLKRPSSAQQIFEGSSQMSHSEPKQLASTSVATAAAAATQPHASPRYSIGPAPPLDLNDPYVMESSPSRGRSSHPHKKNRLNTPGLSDTTIHLPLSPNHAVPDSKPKGLPAHDGFRSPEISEDEEEDDYEDAERESDKGNGDTYTPGATRGQMVVDSGRPEKVNASILSSVRPSSSKVDHALRLKRLMDDIFDAENSAPKGIRDEDVPGTEYFSHTKTTEDGTTRLVLSGSTLEKLLHSLQKMLPRSSGRKSGVTALTSALSVGHADLPTMPTTAQSSISHPASESLRGWSAEDIARLLRMLKRNMLYADVIRPFPDDHFNVRKYNTNASHVAVTSSPVKAGKPAKKKLKASPTKTKITKVDLDEAKVTALHLAIRKLREGVMAARICLSILSTGDLPKQFYSEDLLLSCTDTIRSAIEQVVLPFIEGLSQEGAINSHALAFMLCTLSSDDDSKLVSIFAHLVTDSSICLTHFADLVCNVDFPLPDSMIYKMSSISTKITFAPEPPEGKEATATSKAAVSRVFSGKAGLKSFKGGATNVLKALFPRQSSGQRDSMIEEILSSIFKVAELKKSQTHIRLRSGNSIHFVSALLMELLQSCAFDVGDSIDNLSREANLRSMTSDQMEETGVARNEAEVQAICKRTVELIEKSAFAIVNFLLKKSTATPTGRGGKHASDNDYRAIFETYLLDQITVLYMPEWPVASVSLSVSAKLMMRALEETRSSPEVTIGRAIAIEHLGSLATKLRSIAVQLKSDGHTEIQSIQRILSTLDIDAWRQLRAENEIVTSWLLKRSTSDVLSQHAIQLNMSLRGLELQHAIRQLSVEDEQENMDADRKSQIQDMLNHVKESLRVLNSLAQDDNLFDPESSEEAFMADLASCRLQSARTLQTAYPIILKSILSTLHAPIVGQRTKAIRALGNLITVDPDVLLDREIKVALQDRFADSSPAVRDAVIDLVGKYLLLKPDVAYEYYPLISARVADTGLGVRKRVIKLLKGMYSIIDQQNYRVDTCCRLVSMVADQDEGVKESAIAAVADLWFGDVGRGSNGHTPRPSSSDSDSNLKDTARMIVGTLRRYGESQGQVAEVIEQIAKNKTMLEKYAEIVDVMLESLLENNNRSISETLNLVQAIHLLSKVIPQIITVNKATALLPYLRPASSPDQVALTETLLRMLRISIPQMPKTSVTFAEDLSKLLLPMISRPTGKLSTLEETVSCYCIVVRHVTDDYVRVASMLTSCVTKLRQLYDAWTSGKAPSAQDQKLTPFFIVISSLMVSSCDLDSVKAEKEDIAAVIEKWCQGSVRRYVYELLLGLWEQNVQDGIRHAIIQGLSVIFRAYPTMMLEEASTKLMDDCFSTEATSPETVLRMMTLLHDCLSAEKSEVEANIAIDRNSKAETTTIDISKLIGNTSNFAESGVNSAIVQRYLDKILESALSVFADIQKVAMSILALTIDQGLAHPMQSVPVLISLETSDNEAIADKAFGLHSVLQNKHASIINTRYLESVKMAFQYRQKLEPHVSGCRDADPAVALLERWYSLVREKRIWKQDFLKQMCRAFDFDPSQPDISVETVQLHVFIADNLATFDYKTMEEVFQVLQHLKQLLSVAGQQVLYNLPKLETEDENASIEDAGVVEEDMSLYQGDGTVPSEQLRRAGLTIAIALLARARLKKTYGLTEDKCIKVLVGTKKTAAADKPTHRKIDSSGNIIDWNTVPAILQGMKTVAEYNAFRESLIQLADQDGSIEVNEDDEMDDDSKDEDY